MKNKNWFFIISVLFICSCNSDCDDCGPTGYEEFYIKNTRDTSVNVKWFGFRTFASNLAHEISIASNERILLYRGDQMASQEPLNYPLLTILNGYLIRLNLSSLNNHLFSLKVIVMMLKTLYVKKIMY
jgi:hypothetical protein